MKRLRNLLLFCLLAALLTACGSGADNGQEAQPTEQPTVPTDSATGGGNSERKTVQVQVYYSDANLDKLEAEQRDISYEKENDKYQQAMAMLGEASEQGHEPLWKNFAYHAITFDGGTLTIDADGTNQYNMGSTGEALALEALKRTMFQFPEVERIVILVDGKPADSLMGHADISEPLTR